MRRLLLIAAILMLAGCNLDTTTSLTLTPAESPTPLILPSPTSPALVETPIPVPAQTVVESPPAENILQAIVNNLIVPVISFLFTFVGDAAASLWSLAWERGGSFGQILCCIVPSGGVGLVLFARLRVWRRK